MRLGEIKNTKVNNNNYSQVKLINKYSLKKYESEIKKIEQNYESKLKNYKTTLEVDLNSKKNKIKNSYINKKIEFETKLKKSLSNNESPTDGNALRVKLYHYN